MSTLLPLQKRLLSAGLLLLCLSACIKEPRPDVPGPVTKPAWLLSAITEVTAYGDAVLEQPYYFKLVTEFRYNEFYKPSLQLNYASSTQDDTTNLVLVSKDTFQYDANRRMAEIKTLDRNNRATTLKRLYYSGNDTLPYLFETYYYDSADTPGIRYSSQFSYLGDTAVLTYTPLVKGDSSLSIYEQGNYTTYCRGAGLSQCGRIYEEYTGPNIFLSLNLSHMIGLNISSAYDAYTDGPRMSRGNWQRLNDGNPNHYRSLFFNANGLLSATYWTSYIPEFVSQARFAYIPTE
ncbi:hypothetical protein [uncultured Chitinophaga sp.]|jgi:hypothetical protein|uniref:hypothetical protein n=1 Tax=uncultured Chitinophaga sp. TaxID=339340 RepID=UPI0026033908|nr:hypothetical protein [uncultured Chitinophaga sp.]